MYDLANTQAVGDREEQQDSGGFTSVLDPTVEHAGVLGVLADGMGGLRHGAAVSQLAVRTVLDAYREKTPAESIPGALHRAVLRANDVVLEFARSNGAEGQTATTIVAAVLHRRDLYWISAGDSRAYLVRRGQAYRLTVDHTFGEDSRFKAPAAVGAAQLDPEAVTSFVGSPVAPRVDASVKSLRVNRDDVIVLATDGLYRAITDAEIARAATGKARQVCDRLVRLALERRVPDQDNLTVMALSANNGGMATQLRDRLPRWRRRSVEVR